MKQNLSFDDEDEEVKAKTNALSEEETGFDAFIYQNVGGDKMDDLGTYLKWHREHPHCSTPRAPRRGVESQIAAGSTFRCDEDSEYAGKVYLKFSPKKDSDVPEEFHEKPIGKHFITNEKYLS